MNNTTQTEQTTSNTEEQSNHNQEETEVVQATVSDSAQGEESVQSAELAPKEEDAENLTEMLRKSTDMHNPVMAAQSKFYAQKMQEAGLLPKGFENMYQVQMVLQSGARMGLPPEEAVSSLYIVNGQITVYGSAAIKMVTKHGYRVHYEEDHSQENNEWCTAYVYKGSWDNPDEMYQETVTFQDALSSRYATDRNGKLKLGYYPGTNRRRKLRYMAVTTIVRTYMPQLFDHPIETENE